MHIPFCLFLLQGDEVNEAALAVLSLEKTTGISKGFGNAFVFFTQASFKNSFADNLFSVDDVVPTRPRPCQHHRVCLTPATKPREFSPIFLPPAPLSHGANQGWRSGKRLGWARSLTHKPPPHTSSVEGKLCRCN